MGKAQGQSSINSNRRGVSSWVHKVLKGGVVAEQSWVLKISGRGGSLKNVGGGEKVSTERGVWERVGRADSLLQLRLGRAMGGKEKKGVVWRREGGED